MKKITIILFISVLLMSFGSAFSQSFNKSTDLLLANFDLMPDMDDLHSIAALGSILKHEDYQDINYWAVCGAYGKQDLEYITTAPALMAVVFGDENVNWTDAHNDLSGSVARVTADVVKVINAGGTVWVQEGGQSDFSYDVAIAAQAAGVSAAKIKTNFIIVQHSNYNTNQSTEKSWVIGGDVGYVKIDDANKNSTEDPGNTSPDYQVTDKQFILDAVAESNPNEYAQRYWEVADDMCKAWNRANPTIVAGGIDFSDCGENWYIFGWGTEYMTVQDFFDEFVTNPIEADFPPTVKFITPATTSIEIPEGSESVDIVPVEISATDEEGPVTYVELYLDDSLISKKTALPYTWTDDAILTDLSPGTYTLKAIAEDSIGQTSVALLSIVVQEEADEIIAGDHWISCEIENTKSPLGDWKLRKKGDTDYFDGASGDQYLEFTANSAAGKGSARSPLTYKFTAPKTAQYELLMRYHQNLDNGNGGTYAGDYCNDTYITLEGNFTSGHAKLSEEELRSEQKFFGKGAKWGVGYRITMYTDGEKNYPARYNLIEGETYTFTIAGRSNQTCVDYWLFVDNSEIADMPTAQEDMYTMLDEKYHPFSGPIVPVTGVTASPDSAEIQYLNGTTKLSATVAPSDATNKKVIWSSSDEGVATVSSTGEVTAISAGTTTITATTDFEVDGNGFTDTCVIITKGDTLKVTGVSVSPDSVEIQYLEKTTELSATVAPSNATIKEVTWMSSNEGIAIVSTTGVVTAKGAGTVTITATTVDGDFTDMCVIISKGDSLPSTQITGEFHITKNTFCLYAGDDNRAEGDPVTLQTLVSGETSMTWVENLRADGYYYYQLKGTNFCIDGGDGGAKSQPVVISAFDSENKNQHWTKEYISEGVYRLLKRDFDFAIDPGSTASAIDGKPVGLWISGTTSANLHWTFTDAKGEASSINESAVQSVNIYPNPASDFLMITSDKEMSRVNVYTIDGQLVASQSTSGESYRLTLPEVGQSLLFINVVLKDGSNMMKKIIVE